MKTAEQLCHCAAYAVVRASFEDAAANDAALETRRKGQLLLGVAATREGWDANRAVCQFQAELADINRQIEGLSSGEVSTLLEAWADGCWDELLAS